jgi:cytochrome b subunit of formate dehydrogenase
MLAALAGAPQVVAQECLDCHEVDAEAFAESVHGFLECVDCHDAAGEMPHVEGVEQPACASCHHEIEGEYASSSHGLARLEGGEEAPGCASCHGSIHTLVPSSSEDSPIHPQRLPETCGGCHSNAEVVEKYGIPVAQPLAAYRSSVHGGIMSDGETGPSCQNCHGSHGILSAGDPASMVNHQRVPATCGQCHVEIAEAYAKSVHGKSAAHGSREAPVCTDCHGEHRILSPREIGSPVYATNIPKMTCGRCHGDTRLAMKFGISPDKVPAYEDSYHGLAMRSGSVTVAHCGSCHGVHEVLPATDPQSLVHESRLAETCGHCHPGAGDSFAIGAVHVTAKEREHSVVYWIRFGYLWLIWGTVGGMLLHNMLDIRRKFRDPEMMVALPPARDERMSLGFRIAHVSLAASFFVLVYTGFALTYPEAWWARPLLSWESSFGFRGWLHRSASVVLLAALLFHFIHIVVDRRARACIMLMRPTGEDWHEFRERCAYWFDRNRKAPRAPRLGYPEKLEYLALMWGMVVMAITGFALWFDNLVLRLLPKWIADVATVIHFYEAVLATLAILVWHFYFVIFDPLVYPMDTAWLTGKSAPGRVLERGQPVVEPAENPSNPRKAKKAAVEAERRQPA